MSSPDKASYGMSRQGKATRVLASSGEARSGEFRYVGARQLKSLSGTISQVSLSFGMAR